jgi:hypothetical protein
MREHHERPSRSTRYHDDCWLAWHAHVEHGDPMPCCSGSLVRVHLIPRQLLRRERLPQLDPRTYVYACGGPMGNAGHHGMLDGSRRLRIHYADLPIKVKEFAAEHGLGWWLEREYR